MTINKYTFMMLCAAGMIVLGSMIVDSSSLRCIVYNAGIETKARIGFILGMVIVAAGGGLMAIAIRLDVQS